MLVGLRTELEFVHAFDYLAQVVAALNTVFYLAEDFADFVFDGVGAGGFLLEAVQIREQLAVDEIKQVGAGHCIVVIELAIRGARRGPYGPAIFFVEDKVVLLSIHLGDLRLVVLQRFQIFKEQQPRALLGVIQLAGATGILVQDVVDIFKRLLELVCFLLTRISFGCLLLCNSPRF